MSLPVNYQLFQGTLAADATATVTFTRKVRSVKVKNTTDPRAPVSNLHFRFASGPALATDENLMNREWASYILLTKQVYLLAKNGSADYEVAVTYCD